jgi:DNA-binding Lrp family transcriptional regulator
MLLLKELWLDSRVSFNALGKKLQISGNILKKRADKLEQADVLIYHTNPVFSHFGYGLIVFEAIFPKKDRDNYINKIALNFPQVYDIILSLSNKCAITTLLPIQSENGISDDTINKFISNFQQKIPEIPIIRQYIMKYQKPNELHLKDLELKLIRLLREHSRRDLNDLSEKLNLSKKTLSRYLQKFLDLEIIKHTIGLQPSKIKGYIIHLLFIEFKNYKILEKEVKILREKIPWLSYYILKEPPGCAMYVYTESLAEMEEIYADINKNTEIKEVNIFFPSSIIRFESWKKMIFPEKK